MDVSQLDDYPEASTYCVEKSIVFFSTGLMIVGAETSIKMKSKRKGKHWETLYKSGLKFIFKEALAIKKEEVHFKVNTNLGVPDLLLHPHHQIHHEHVSLVA